MSEKDQSEIKIEMFSPTDSLKTTNIYCVYHIGQTTAECLMVLLER